MTKLLQVLRRSMLLAIGVLSLSACAVVVPPQDWDPNAPQGGRHCTMMDVAGASELACCCCKAMRGEGGVVDAKAPKGGKKCAMKMDGAAAPEGKKPALSPMQHGAKP